MLFLVLLSLVSADVYMHNPRGANDRNCERNVNRNNGNLLYDTQNNAKGGYACPRAVAANNDAQPPKGMTPRMKFEEGSSLEVEWTAQHGCGLQKEDGAAGGNVNKKAVMAQNSNVHCEIVLQMGCASTLDPQGLYGGANQMPSGIPAVPREGIPNSDGDSATNRISTTDPGQAVLANNVNNNVRYGVHETPEYYNECNRVKRNRDLFTADQNVNRRSAIGTRQNPNGGRRGLECPEERDYYPYWRPSPFLDVAYLVDDQERCGAGPANPTANPALWSGCGGNNLNGPCTATGTEADTVLQAQGFSAVLPAQGFSAQAAAAVKPGSCVLASTSKVPKNNNGLTGDARNLYNRREWPSNKAACDTLTAANADIQWKELMFNPVFDMTAPKNQPLMLEAMKGAECNTIDYSRSNHLGNSGGADTATRYTMKIPAINSGTVATVGANCVGCLVPEGEPCFLRIRYNMSSADYARNLSSANNGNNSPIQQDPLVTLGNAGTTDGENVVQLALNTNQVARTFQDRSYVFYVKPRPATRTQAQNVVNVNTRGKRGNIVQTYPAVEYDLIPNMVEADPNTILHMQWTGSDYNPRRGCNDGEGGPYTGDNNVIERVIANANTQGSNQNSRTDRTNLVALNVGSKKNYPYSDVGGAPKLMYGNDQLFSSQAQAMKFMSADAIGQLKAINRACLTAQQIENINNENRRENHPRNCAEANALSPYFATEEITFTNAQVGDVYVAYSSRNNNFSNRDTKLKAMVVNSVTVPQEQNPNTLPQEFTASNEFMKSSANSGLQYDAVTGSYDSAAAIDSTADADIPGFDPVENDDYGTGAKEGCTQEMIFYAGASSQYSFQLAAVCCFLMFVLF